MTYSPRIAREIGRKTFSVEDQKLFATISLDVNPLHMDPIAARRLLTGKQAVHGIHVLLAAIELWRNEQNVRPTSLSCHFANLISVGDEVVFSQETREAGLSIIEGKVNGLLSIRINISTVMVMVSDPDLAKYSVDDEVINVDNLNSPRDTAPMDHLGRVYAITVREGGWSAYFSQSTRYLGSKAFAAVCSLSYIVGMVCPGLHSIFSSFDAQFNDDLDCEDLLHFRCDDYDDRFGLFQISVRGCIKGRIKAFWRPSPSKGPNVFELAKIVPRDEFKGTKSLVIGGSRGLGSVTARILAAGGGNVVITYAMGFEQALEINDEINHWRQSASEMVKFDLTTDSFKSMSLPFDSLDSVYYFPTPRIFIKKAAIFDPKMFLEFSLFYVSKFYELCRHLEEVVEKPIQIFFPSSVFIEDRPHGVTEYAMAKSAAEVLIADVNKNFKKVYVTSVRLPRLNTDQTATMFKNIPTESNVEALLPIIRSLNSRIDRK